LAGRGDDAGVKKLLNAKADTSIRDKMGRTPEKYAKEKRQEVCAGAIRDAVQRAQEAKIEVERAQASPFAPFLKEGDETSPSSRGLSVVVYHQIQWLIFKGYVVNPTTRDITERVLSCLRSTETCLALSVLKDFEERCDRRERVRSLEFEVIAELDRFRTLRGIWQGCQRGKPFGFIQAENGNRIWCHERQVKDEEIQEGTKVSFEIRMGRSGKPEASMVQALHSAGSSKGKRGALFATRGADYSGQQCPIPPKLLMMSLEEATVMCDMGAVTQQNIETPNLDKIHILPQCDRDLFSIDALFSTPGFEVAQVQQCSQSLEATKSQLDEKDIRVWKQHTKKTLLNREVTFAVRDNVRAEMCTIAFLKMYEMLYAYDLVQPAEPEKFNSLHLCEAPGNMKLTFPKSH
jgi:cold shock CspA family protein